MVQRNNNYVFINDLGNGSNATVISTQENANRSRTLVANYNDPTLYDQPQLQILNDPGGSNMQVQYNTGIGFGGSSNLIYNYANSMLSLRGNLYVTGNISGNIATNFQNFSISGGNFNQILTTNGNGQLFWSSIEPSGGLFNGNSNIVINPNADITFSSAGTPNIIVVSNTGATFSGLTNLGETGNITIDGGGPNQFLGTDGNGNLFWNYPTTVFISETAPEVGIANLWFNSAEGRAYINYDGNSWVDFSPAVMPNPDMFANTITFPDGSVQTTAGGGGGNPFNQNLNTTNNVTFSSVTATTGNLAQINGVNAGGTLVIQTGGSKNWNFSNSGILSLPFDNYLETTNIDLKAGSQGNVTIRANAAGGANLQSWLFDKTGNITFPDSTKQRTAFTGSIAGANVSGAVGSATTAGTVTTAAQPNITSLGVLTSLSLTGNINTTGNITANIFTGNGSGLTNIVSLQAETVTSSSQPNITSTGTLTGLTISGILNSTNTTDAISPIIGAIKTAGGIAARGNIIGNNHLYVGPGASLTAFINPVFIGKQVGEAYVQSAMINSADTGSSDWVAYADNGTESGGWADFGFTSSAFNDPEYTVTGPNDGYFLVQAQSGSYGGNLVLATGDQGTVNDIIFATGGFQTGNIFGRINHATQTLDIPNGNANIGGSLAVGGTANVDGNAKFNGNVLITNDLQVNGNINFNGDVTQISGVSGQFFGDANGIGALYAGVSAGYSVVPNPVIQAAASTNDYVQINFQNIDGGNTASAEYVITSDNGDDTINYIDMGIASGSWDGTQTNSVGDAAAADDGWVYVQGGTGGGNLVLGTTATNTGIKFLAGAAGAANIRATITSTGLSVAGNVTAANFVGDGSKLSSITGANVTGFVENANIANTAYSVAGANVSGAVSFATTANAVAGANVSGAVSFATTANAVAGANVSGAVSFATTANSVAAANVAGLGNIATLNLTGSSSNILYGNGVFAPAAGGSYGDSNVVILLGTFGSNTVSTTGNITSGNLITGGRVVATGNIVTGGQIQSNAFTGGNISWSVNNQTDFQGAIKVGGTGIIKSPGGAGSITLNNNGANIPILGVTNTSNSTSTTTGALIVSGGAGVAGNIYAGGLVSVTGNITTGGTFVGNGAGLTNVTVNAAGNIQGTSSNVSLVAGSYTMTFDNTGIVTLPAAASGNEGGEIDFGKAPNSSLSGNTVVLDQYADRFRFFEGGGTNRGVYIDLTQAAASVGTLLNNRVSGFVNAGTFVTMDLIKATVTSSGNRGLSLATTTGTFTYNIGGTYATTSSTTGGQSLNAQSLTTSATTSIFGWNFGAAGETSTYILNDTTNSRAYRITLQIATSYNNNMISIERLI